MNIPFLDLKTPHQELEEELVEVYRECLRNASFVGGPQVQAFEEEFAQFCETKYCVAVSSGTDALRFALIAAGIGPGYEVITVPNTFIATTEAISQTGATPAFVDINEQTYNMDPSKQEDFLKKRYALGAMRSASRPRAVLPVHLYGQPADMDSILEIANRYGLIVIEDACQAHGALYYSEKDKKWKKVGSMGLAAAFSFYPGKNLGACGEGGAVTTNNEDVAKKVRMLRDHGQAKKYYHEFEGYNGRLDAIQAGILRIKLKHLPNWNEKRRQNAYQYNELLNGANNVVVPYEPAWSKAVYHLYIIRTQKRDDLQRYLSENGINTGLHYPIPIHLQNAYKNLNLPNGDYPITEKVAQEILSLPMFPNLTVEQIGYVSEKVKNFYD
ncbi:MAG: DegT/DnrJ/EryC1/StrS family aminotransferase [Thermodesulfobacteriota bacterium]|jgi:dTDP-4-amino-4,6-dideoxygalactose transaminase